MQNEREQKVQLIRNQQYLEKSRPGREALWFLDEQPSNFDPCKAHRLLGYTVPRLDFFEAWMTNHESYQDRIPAKDGKILGKFLKKKPSESTLSPPMAEKVCPCLS